MSIAKVGPKASWMSRLAVSIFQRKPVMPERFLKDRDLGGPVGWNKTVNTDREFCGPANSVKLQELRWQEAKRFSMDRDLGGPQHRKYFRWEKVTAFNDSKYPPLYSGNGLLDLLVQMKFLRREKVGFNPADPPAGQLKFDRFTRDRDLGGPAPKNTTKPE